MHGASGRRPGTRRTGGGSHISMIRSRTRNICPRRRYVSPMRTGWFPRFAGRCCIFVPRNWWISRERFVCRRRMNLDWTLTRRPSSSLSARRYGGIYLLLTSSLRLGYRRNILHLDSTSLIILLLLPVYLLLCVSFALLPCRLALSS